MNAVQPGKITSLYLTYDGLTDPLGQSQILPYLLGLEGKGITFHIISFEKKELFKKNENLIRELIRDKNIFWIPLTYHKRPPVLSTLLDIRNLKRITKKVVKEHPIDVVHCRSYITALIGLWLKKKHGLKFLFDMRGFWVDERIEGEIWNIKNPIFNFIYQYFKRKELDFFNQADAIISLTDNAKGEIIKLLIPYEEDPLSNQQINKSSYHHITTIPCCTDLELFNNSRILKSWRNELKENLAGDFPIRLIYVGSLGTWYMLEEMLDFYEAMLNMGMNCQIIFLTREQPILMEELAKRGWKDIQSRQNLFQQPLFRYAHPHYDHSEIIVTQTKRSFVPYFMDYSDASILFIKPSFSKKASSATKMGESLALNKPVITNFNWGDVDLFASQSNSILLVKEFNKANYEMVAKNLKQLIDSGKIDALNFARKRLSLDTGIQKYFEVYNLLSP